MDDEVIQIVEKLFKYKNCLNIPWIRFFKYLILKELLMKLANKITIGRQNYLKRNTVYWYAGQFRWDFNYERK